MCTWPVFVEGQEVLSIRGLRLIFDEKVLLEAESVSLERGRCTTLLMRSGSGRSSVARMLSGLPVINPRFTFSGEARYGKASPSSIDNPSWRHIVALVPQNFFRYLTEFRVIDEMLCLLEIANVPEHLAYARVREAANRVGITHLLSRNPLTLSGGEIQRLAVAAALCRDPEILILDEPFAELDLEILPELEVLLADVLPAQGVSVCIITDTVTESLLRRSNSYYLRGHQLLPIESVQVAQLGHECIYLSSEVGLDLAQEGSVRANDERDCRPVIRYDASDILYTLEDLTFYYPRQRHAALEKLTAQFCRGRSIAVTGENGAGKSTLLSILLGFEPVPKSSLRLAVHKDNELSFAAMRARSGVVFQTYHHYFFGSTVLEELELAFENRVKRSIHYSRAPAYQISDPQEAIKRFNLASVMGEIVDNISMQERRLLALAGALIQMIDILILDEPTAGLDACGRMLLIREIERIERRYSLMVVISHDRPFLKCSCDYELALRRGRLDYFGPIRLSGPSQ